MADKVLEYLSVLYEVVSGMESSLDYQASDADNGESTTVAEGKEQALDHVDGLISQLTELHADIGKMSLKKLQEKYQ